MLLQLQGINFGFSPEKQIFQNLSFNIEQGRIYSLMGANGSGKTTLFNLICGFHQVSSGKIVFKQHNLTKYKPYQINRVGISRTFQDLRLISKLTVKENVILAMQGNPTDNWIKALLPAKIFRNELQQLEEKAKYLLAKYFLQDVQDAMAHEISFGQQKLLNLACCVANGGKLLLLDEPIAGISHDYREQITILIKQLKQDGITILMIEHNTDFIVETADYFIFLNNGILTEFSSFTNLQNSSQAQDAYF